MTRMKTRKMICISLGILCACCGEISLGAESKSNSAPVTAILGAFEREVTLIEDQVKQRRDRKIEGIRFVSDKLNGQQVLVTWTGVGKVNAAMTTTLLIEHYKPKQMFYIMAARNSASLVARMVGLLETRLAAEKNAGSEKPGD